MSGGRDGEEPHLAYRDGLTGQRHCFTRSCEEVVVTFNPEAVGEEQVRALADEAGAEAGKPINTVWGFTVLRVTRDRYDETVERLSADARITGLRPAMIDPGDDTRYFLPGELTVQFLEDVDRAEVEQLTREFGGEVLADYGLVGTPGLYTISLAAGRGLFGELQRWQDTGRVRFAAPSEVGFDEADYDASHNPEFTRQWALRTIDAPGAWDLERGDPDVVVAVIDSGLDARHADLAANVLPRGDEDWSFVHKPGHPRDVDPTQDLTGHGTQVAGIAVADDDGHGIIGVAPGCRVMPLRIDTDAGRYAARAAAINAVVNHARANPHRRYVINCSWHINGVESPDAPILTAIRSAVTEEVLSTGQARRGIVVVFSAGNDGAPHARLPGRYEEVVAVAATDQADRREPDSNYGAGVDLCAPGAAIRTTTEGGGHLDVSGTSFAAPHVAGVAALVLSRNPALTVPQVRAIIEGACDDIDAANPAHLKGGLGRGRLNAHRALLSTPLPGLAS